MKRNMTLKVINPILGLLIVNQMLTGIFNGGLSHDAFEILHEGGGYLLAVGIAIHVVLNWNWIKTSYFKKKTTA